MNQKICLSKKIVYIGLFVSFLFSLVILSRMALQSNQSTNSRAAGPELSPAPQVSVIAPGCYNPIPRQICLNPVYEKGINKLELSLTSVDLQDLKDESQSMGYKNYAIMGVYKDQSQLIPQTFTVKGKTYTQETASYIHTLLGVLSTSEITSPNVFAIDNINSKINFQKPYSFIIFGIPSVIDVNGNSTQQGNFEKNVCAVQNSFVDSCTSIKSD